ERHRHARGFVAPPTLYIPTVGDRADPRLGTEDAGVGRAKCEVADHADRRGALVAAWGFRPAPTSYGARSDRRHLADAARGGPRGNQVRSLPLVVPRSDRQRCGALSGDLSLLGGIYRHGGSAPWFDAIDT